MDMEGGRDIYAHNLTALPRGLAGQRYVYPAVPGASLDYTPGVAPRYWSVAAARTVMARWPDYAQAYFNAWTYVNGYMACALERLYEDTGEKAYMEYIKTYMDRFIDTGGDFVPVANNKGIAAVPSYCDNLDGMMTGNTLVMLYEHYADERYRMVAERIAACMKAYPRNRDGGFWHSARMGGQMWIDGIFMGQMFLLRYGRSIGESQWAWDEAVRQITSYARRGQQGDSGLYVHGIYESGHDQRPCPWADPVTGKSPEVWGEGLGWYALVLVEALETIPRDHEGYESIEHIYLRLAQGLKRTQDRVSGGWYQVVDKGHVPNNWIETSGSAMFTYALKKGIDLGLLDEKDYGPVVEGGYRSITAHAAVNSDGLVDIYEACDGLGVQDSYEKYVNCSRYAINAKEAVAGFIWATEIMERELLQNREK
jgi:unsaturated rhamnogalacturonyl hydrolase